MSRRIREHLRSNVIGYVALFLVLTGGTAYALDGSNTVFSDDIVNGEVDTADIALNAIASNRIENGQVLSADVANGNLTGIDVANGSLTGDDVDQASLNSVVTATTPIYLTEVGGVIANGSNAFVTASCDPGDRLQSGGYINKTAGAVVEDSSGGGSSWTVEIDGTNGNSVTTRASCWDFPPLH